MPAILRRAATQPSRPALVGPTQTLSYGALANAVRAYAEVVSAVVPHDAGPIAVEARREPTTVVAVLGVLLAGRSYLPLNPADPPVRRQGVLAAAGVRHRVGDELPLPRLDATPTGAAPVAEPHADQLAYVLSTSGSTGVPKAVPITHGNALAFVDWAARRFRLRADDIIAVYSPLYFDLAVLDVFVGLRCGAALVLVPDAVVSFGAAVHDVLAGSGATVIYAVPSAFLAVARASGGRPLPDLRLVLLAGEPFPVDDLELLRGLAPHAHWHNLYGPIETNVIAHFPVPTTWRQGVPLPIGTAVDDATLCVVDAAGTRVIRTGEHGELIVRGPSVFSGYLDTGAAPPSPFVELEGHRWFRTGDRASAAPDGTLAFHGRADDRFKRNGYLVEPAEIEAALRQHESVSAAAVATAAHDSGVVVHAFVVAGRAHQQLVPREVLRHCSRLLPRFMWPDQVHVVADLPVGRTGKVDRAGLLHQMTDDG